LCFLNILFMVVYSCKECGELNYLTPSAFCNITDWSGYQISYDAIIMESCYLGMLLLYKVAEINTSTAALIL
jgi:hypothetical protein